MNRLLARYIFDEASPRERERVERWMGRSPRNREEVERLRERVETGTRRYRAGVFDARAALARVVPRGDGRRVLAARRAVAAAVVLLAGVAWLLFPSSPREVTIAARAGEERVVLLPDSSRVTLSGPASVGYRAGFNGERREVYASGTVYFEVKADTLRPFTVSTALLEARVLGTTFQVEAGAARAEVLVKEGRVRVSTGPGDAGEVLSAGMSASRGAGQEAIAVTRAFDANRLSWKTGEFFFNNTPLSEVVRLLNRHFHAAIALPDSLAGTRITVSFYHPTLAEALDIINQTLDTRVSY
jgi:ferric-dicitrate binding protein FerR (iron transport regulator)